MVGNAGFDRQLIHATDIRKWWAWVSKGLQVVLRYSNDSWIPEDIYTALITGHSRLYVGARDAPEAFAIITPKVGFAGPYWFVWAAWGKAKDYLPMLEDVARAEGAKRLVLQSPRAGWARHWVAVHTEYERQL